MNKQNGSDPNKESTLVIGAGLAGLSCAFELVDRGQPVLVLEAGRVVGGRTANWDADGMEVESGYHKFLGYYEALPELLKRAGIDPDEMLIWEHSMEIRHPDADKPGVFGLDPVRAPLKTLAGAIGNNELISPADKASLAPFFAKGFRDAAAKPEELDELSVLAYARMHNVTDRAIERIVEPLSSGVFFLPPERFSAYAFFGLFGHVLPRLHKMRIGAFAGGMTDVMTGPLAAAIERRGGRVRTGAPVERLLVEGGSVKGVVLGNGEEIRAHRVVVAANLRPAQRLVAGAVGSHPWFRPFLSLDAMPYVTVQFEAEEPLLPAGHTIFGPGTNLGSFAEQSRTTFRGRPGRASIIIVDPDRHIDRPAEDVFRMTSDDLLRIGLPAAKTATQFRVVRSAQHFYRIAPGNERKRPTQETPVPGLFLAGDYTKQTMFCTMEGAVISGRKAAEAVLRQLGQPAGT